MLPEYLKGKPSLDEWKILISMHLVRIKAYNSGRMSKLLGKIALIPADLFFLRLFYIPLPAAGAVGYGYCSPKANIYAPRGSERIFPSSLLILPEL